MTMDKQIADRLESLNNALKAQKEIVKKKERSVKRAEKNLGAEKEVHYSLLCERDLALVQSWGNNPDWSVLLNGGSDYSRIICNLASAAIKKLGLSTFGINIDTNQRALFIHFESSSDGERQQIKEGIQFISRHLLPNNNGRKAVCVSSDTPFDYALHLEFDAQGENYYLVKSEYAQTIERIPFTTLDNALAYIQQHLSGLDYIEPAKDLLESIK